MEYIINIEHLTREFKSLNRSSGFKGSILDLFSKDYSIIKAVDDISLKIEKGEIVGFLGPNGAGKSTTIKMMIGVLKQTSGKLFVNGMEPYKEHSEYIKNIGVVFGQRTQLWWALPVRESFYILKSIYDISDQDFNENMALFEEIVGISELIDKPVRQLSLGQRTLCDILAAFLHNPTVVFLDEPTIGLDVSMKHKIHTLIKNLNTRKKTTVVLTTHDMGDVDALCSRVIVINKGKSIFDDSIEELAKYFGDYQKLKLKYEGDEYSFYKKCKDVIDAKSNMEDAVFITDDEQEFGLLVNESKISVLQVLNLLHDNLLITDFNVSNISTEEVIRKMYEDGVKN